MSQQKTDTTNYIVNDIYETFFDSTINLSLDNSIFPTYDVSYDTNFIVSNTANAKITLLLKNYSIVNSLEYGLFRKSLTNVPHIDLSESLFFKGAKTTFNTKNELCILNTIFINDSCAFIKADYIWNKDILLKEIKSTNFVNYHDGAILNFELGEIEIIPQGMACMDTGKNGLIFRTNNGQTNFGVMQNIEVFEFDTDKSGQKEIYIISYGSCSGDMLILKIE